MLSSLEFFIVSSKYKDYYSSEKDLRKTNYKRKQEGRKGGKKTKVNPLNSASVTF